MVRFWDSAPRIQDAALLPNRSQTDPSSRIRNIRVLEGLEGRRPRVRFEPQIVVPVLYRPFLPSPPAKPLRGLQYLFPIYTTIPQGGLRDLTRVTSIRAEFTLPRNSNRPKDFAPLQQRPRRAQHDPHAESELPIGRYHL